MDVFELLGEFLKLPQEILSGISFELLGGLTAWDIFMGLFFIDVAAICLAFILKKKEDK